MRPTKKQKEIGLEEGWGTFEVEYGYGVFRQWDTDLLCIQRIDEMGTFESDWGAIRQAKKDGFKIIDIPKKLAKEYDLYGVIDTEKNREILKHEYGIEL